MSAELAAILQGATGSRGKLKRQAAWLDAQPLALRVALIDYCRAKGTELADDAHAWPAKRLLRACLDRSDAAQVRLNPIHRDEDFDCAHCGAAVAAHGRTARDHCPRCLRSLHVDIVPGDRAMDCMGVLDPVRVELRGAQLVIHYTCRRCGAHKVNRAIEDGDCPDDIVQLARVSSGQVG